MTVFVDSDPATPIVIYVPPVKILRHPELGDPERIYSQPIKLQILVIQKLMQSV